MEDYTNFDGGEGTVKVSILIPCVITTIDKYKTIYSRYIFVGINILISK